MSASPVAAECHENKHPYCQGQALDREADELVACKCDCHQQAKVTLYVPESSCVQCTSTKRKLDKEGISFQTITVRDQDKVMAEEFRTVAAEMGADPTFPVVHVFHPGEQEAEVWFGNQPHRIESIKERRSA